MVNIGIVGCGNWSKIIALEIQKNEKFNLTSIVCRNKKNIPKKLKVFSSIKSMVESNLNDCIYVAALPETNLEVVKMVNNKKIHLILEKPISNSTIEFKKLIKIAEKNKLILYPNLSNYFADTFSVLRNKILKNFEEIKEIIIYEGSQGPFREKIHPIWDWSFHSISLLYLIFSDREFTNITSKEIKSSKKDGNGLVTKFTFFIDKKIKVKVVNGNLFKKKIRKIKIIFNNKAYLENDMILHKMNNKNFNKSKKIKTPVTNLLEKFENDIASNEYKRSVKLIKASSKTISFLEKFY
tara:strand:- start:1726 stop:2613 length:888 start_codon:yes stop_codon:yes gene_type:complete